MRRPLLTLSGLVLLAAVVPNHALAQNTAASSPTLADYAVFTKGLTPPQACKKYFMGI